eukprot:4051316-Prymnesium_polylepis.1
MAEVETAEVVMAAARVVGVKAAVGLEEEETAVDSAVVTVATAVGSVVCSGVAVKVEAVTEVDSEVAETV